VYVILTSAYSFRHKDIWYIIISNNTMKIYISRILLFLFLYVYFNIDERRSLWKQIINLHVWAYKRSTSVKRNNGSFVFENGITKPFASSGSNCGGTDFPREWRQGEVWTKDIREVKWVHRGGMLQRLFNDRGTMDWPSHCTAKIVTIKIVIKKY